MKNFPGIMYFVKFNRRVSRSFFAKVRRVFLSATLRLTFACFAVLFLPRSGFSQQANVPLNNDWMWESEAKMVKYGGFFVSGNLFQYDADTSLSHPGRPPIIVDTTDSGMHAIFGGGVYDLVPIHSSMHPWIEMGHPLRKNIVYDNTLDQPLYETHDTYSHPYNWIKKYHYFNSLLYLNRPAQNGEPLFRLNIDPLLDLNYMNVSGDTFNSKYYINTRGVTAHGDIGTKISFETSFWENQAFFPQYIRDFADYYKVVPGQGRWKAFKKTGYDYASVAGYISWSPCSYFNIQAGHGKFFVGDGYRSLLLSDNSFAYPFLRFTSWFGKNKMFQYSAIYASLMNLVSNTAIPVGTERLFQKKAASFQQLSMNIGHIGEISLFQGLIWNAADVNNIQHMNFYYYNPIIFTSLPAYGLNSYNNYLLGATFRFDVLKTISVYGQYLADDLGKKGTVRNKTGFQIGAKYYNAFTLKHLHLQVEFNKVNPYAYSSADSAQAYTQYNQPLAHPLGANFSEITGSVHYKIGDFFFIARFTKATIGADTAGHDFGQNVFAPNTFAYYGQNSNNNVFGQGQKTSLTYYNLQVGYMISYASNLNIAVGYSNRTESPANLLNSGFVYVSVRTSLTNNYFDFFRK